MKTQELESDTVKQSVRQRYGRIAEDSGSCGCAPTCCSPKGTSTKDEPDAAAVSQGLGSGAKSGVQRGRGQLKQMLDECCTFEFDRRGKVIDCAPRATGGCGECSQGQKANTRHSSAKATR